MTPNDNKYAISLEHHRIALLKRTGVGVWEVEDNCSIETLDEAQISAAFLPFAKKWHKSAKQVSVCLPSNAIKITPTKQPLSTEDGVKILREEFGGAAKDRVIVSRETEPFGYCIFEVEHVELARKFVTKFGFEAIEFGHNQGNLQQSSPQFFPADKFFDTKLSVPEKEQAQLDFDPNQLVTVPAIQSEQIQPNSDETKSIADIAQQEPPLDSPIVAEQHSNKKYGLLIAPLLVVLLASFWVWNSRDASGAPESEVPAIASESTTTSQTSSIETNEASSDPTEDVSVFTLPPDFLLAARPENHAQAVERAEIDQSVLVGSLPEFAIVERPLTHAAFVESFLENGQGEQASTATITSPNARPDDLPDPTTNTELVLIGISGSAGHPGALIQASDGSYKSVKTGDEVDGWKIEAISKSQVIIRKGDKKETLEVPS